MNIKPIVKIMNFHSLLRVDSSKRQAEQYRKMEIEILEMLDLIVNNKNFILDTKIMNPPKNKLKLNIYIGSDLGFCGNINTSISSLFNKDKSENYKIVVGKKIGLLKGADLVFSRDDMKNESSFEIIRRHIIEGIEGKKYSEINLIYNYYYNSSRIETVTKMIYPIASEKVSQNRYSGDFAVEGETEEILINILSTFIMYEIKIAFKNSFASENILREATTSQSLRKIDEIEDENEKLQRKKNAEKVTKKILENYMKKSFGGQKNDR